MALLLAMLKGVKTINRMCPSQLQIRISWLFCSMWSLFDNGWWWRRRKMTYRPVAGFAAGKKWSIFTKDFIQDPVLFHTHLLLYHAKLLIHGLEMEAEEPRSVEKILEVSESNISDLLRYRRHERRRWSVRVVQNLGCSRRRRTCSRS